MIVFMLVFGPCVLPAAALNLCKTGNFKMLKTFHTDFIMSREISRTSFA